MLKLQEQGRIRGWVANAAETGKVGAIGVGGYGIYRIILGSPISGSLWLFGSVFFYAGLEAFSREFKKQETALTDMGSKVKKVLELGHTLLDSINVTLSVPLAPLPEQVDVLTQRKDRVLQILDELERDAHAWR